MDPALRAPFGVVDRVSLVLAEFERVILAVADREVLDGERGNVDDVVALAENDDRAVSVRQVCLRRRKGAVVDGQRDRVAFEVEGEFHAEPMGVEQLLPVDFRRYQVAFPLFVEFEEVVALPVVEQVVDFVALLVLDAQDVTDFGDRIEPDVEFDVEPVRERRNAFVEDIVRGPLVDRQFGAVEFQALRGRGMNRSQCNEEECMVVSAHDTFGGSVLQR